MSGSLYQYRFDYSSLSPEEFSDLEKRIDHVSWTSLSVNPQLQIGEFFLLASCSDDYLKYINIPAKCNLRRIH